jgi:phosphoribosyl 1,2-cyclic phosphate phosphodiesterase
MDLHKDIDFNEQQKQEVKPVSAGKMTITLLGTGTSQGVPVVACDCSVCRSSDDRDKRLRASVLVETPGNVFAIDAGPDFRQQMLRENVKHLDAILITHEHKDHIGGLDDIRAFNWIMQKPMEIYASEIALDTIRRDFFYAFEAVKYPGVPQINLHQVNEKAFRKQNDIIIPIKAIHGNLPVLGFRIGDFSYLTDASYIASEEVDKMKGSKVIIINGLRRKKHHSHFNLDESVELLQALAPDKGYITHISHQMGYYREINAELPSGIELAYDGLKITLDY